MLTINFVNKMWIRFLPLKRIDYETRDFLCYRKNTVEIELPTLNEEILTILKNSQEENLVRENKCSSITTTTTNTTSQTEVHF